MSISLRSRTESVRALLRAFGAIAALFMLASSVVAAQAPGDTVLRISLGSGRSWPIHTDVAVTKIAVADPEVADAIVVGDRDLVINGKKHGETDIVIWTGDLPRLHYRVAVRPVADRRMILLSVKLAEVRRDALYQLGVSGLQHTPDGKVRAGTGSLRNQQQFDSTGKFVIPLDTKFLTLLSDFGTKDLLAMLDAEEQAGRARLLAEPNLLASNRDSASFLAGGELPIPIAYPSATGVPTVTIQWREFGVKLNFVPEIISDSMIKLWVRPEVSSLDYSNALVLQGFRIPALLTRRITSTVDVKANQSLVLSGLFNEQREQVRTGIPFLMHIPLLGALFSSSRWQSAENELIVIVTPTLIDPDNVDASLLRASAKETRTPAAEALDKRPPVKP